MSELSLSSQDVETLAEALELLLHRVGGREDLPPTLQGSIQSLLERVKEMSDGGRMQVIAAIRKSLSEIAAELESSEPDAPA